MPSDESDHAPAPVAARLRRRRPARSVASGVGSYAESEGEDDTTRELDDLDYVPAQPCTPPAEANGELLAEQVDETPQQHVLTGRLAPADKERMYQACGGDLRCSISWETGNSEDHAGQDIEYCHVIPFKWAGIKGPQSALNGKPGAAKIYLLGFVLGFKPGELNLNTHCNIMMLRADWHRLFDSSCFFLVPKDPMVSKHVTDFFLMNTHPRAMKTWRPDNETRFMFQTNESLPADKRYVYRVVPLLDWPDRRDIIRRRKNSVSEDTFQEKYAWYPFPKFENPNEAERELTIETHIHPLFAAIHAAWHCSQLQDQSRLSISLDSAAKGFIASATTLFNEGEFSERLVVHLSDDFIADSTDKMAQALANRRSPSERVKSRQNKDCGKGKQREALAEEKVHDSDDVFSAGTRISRAAMSEPVQPGKKGKGKGKGKLKLPRLPPLTPLTRSTEESGSVAGPSSPRGAAEGKAASAAGSSRSSKKRKLGK